VSHPLGRLARGTLIYGVGGALTRLLALLLLPVFTAYLSTAEYGAVATLTLLSAALTGVFSCGLTVAIGLRYFEKAAPAHRSATIWTAFAVLSASVGVLLVLGACTYRLAAEWLFANDRYGDVVLLSIFASGAGILVQPLSLYFQYRERAVEFAAISLASAVVGAAVSLYLVVALGRGVTGIVVGTLVAQVAALVMFLTDALRAAPPALDHNTARSLLRRGLPMVPSFLCLYILLQGNQVVLKEISGLNELGVYSVEFSLGMAMSLLINAFTTAWPPFFLSYWNDRDRAQQLFRQAFTYYLLALGTVSLLFFVWAKPVVMTVAAKSYLESYRVVGWAATAQLLSGVFSLLLPAAYFSGRVGVVTPVQALSAVVSAGAAIGLIRSFGVTGAAYSLVLGYLAMCALQYAWNRAGQKVFQMTYDWHRIGRFVAGYLLIAVTFATMEPGAFWPEILKSAAGSVVAGLLALALLTEQERRLVFERIRAVSRPASTE